MVGLWVTVSLAMFSGLTMFSIYKNCDPLGNGDVSTSDQVGRAAAFPVCVFIASTSPHVMEQCCLFASCCLTLWWTFWQFTRESLACLWPLHTAAPWGEAPAHFPDISHEFLAGRKPECMTRFRWCDWIVGCVDFCLDHFTVRLIRELLIVGNATWSTWSRLYLLSNLLTFNGVMWRITSFLQHGVFKH